MTGPVSPAVRPCGSNAAHRPHQLCPGIMPIWPCRGRDLAWLHVAHHVTFRWGRHGEGYFCPGTIDPPTDMTGPWYQIGAYGWTPTSPATSAAAEEQGADHEQQQ